MAKVVVFAIVVAAVVGAILWRRATIGRQVPAREQLALATSDSAQAPGVTSPPADAEVAEPPRRVRRLAPGERERLKAAIARARAESAATPAPATPALGSATADDPERVLELMLAALAEIKPFMKECYEAEAARTSTPTRDVRAALTLIGDAEVGALIEHGEVTDGDGQPLAAPYAECLRETLASLAIPPDFDGDEFRISMAWTFDE